MAETMHLQGQMAEIDINALARKSQKARLLAWLRHKPITGLQAWKFLRILNYKGRIHDLRRDGHIIETRYIEVANRYGERCRVAQYWLKEEA